MMLRTLFFLPFAAFLIGNATAQSGIEGGDRDPREVNFIKDIRRVPDAVWQAELRQKFGIEAELTGKLLAMKERIFEVPISYRARGREEGKKIQWTDGVAALWHIIKFNVFKI